jgi:hypothetical protein
MAYVIIRQKVADYAGWKPLFDADGASRQAGGSRGGQLFRSADDPNQVVILLEWGLEQARQFSQREELYLPEEIEPLSR